MRSVLKPVFFYGTLRDGDVLSRVLGRKVAPVRLKPAVLKDHRTVYVRGRRYPMLSGAPGHDTQGFFLQDCTPQEWTRLMRYEGPEYGVHSVEVWVEGLPVLARVFQVTQKSRASARIWTLEAWRRAHKRRYLRRLRPN